MDGQQLVDDYRTAMATAVTADLATYEAERSENDVLNHLDAVSSGRYLQPANIDSDDQADITRTSLDAHFKKVQASQLSAMSAAQLQAMTEQDLATYHGRRLQVTVLAKINDVIELTMYDPQHGYYIAPTTRRTVTGIIEAIDFEKNTLILRPKLGIQLLNRRLQNYVVYVIDPDSLLPLVKLRLL